MIVVRAFLAVVLSASFLELVGAGLIVAGVAVLGGAGAALIAGGVCAVLKAFASEASP